jgi:hypothetical protein
VHTVGEVHDTPVNSLYAKPDDTMAHALPFQYSANDWGEPAPPE